MGHGRDKRDPPARPSRRRQREERACRVRLRNVEHRGHSIQRHAQRAFDGSRSRQARPSRATIPEDKREGRACRVRLRNVEHRGHPIQRHAQRAFDGARSRQARPSRAPVPFDGSRSRQARPSRATIPEDKREGRACRVRLRNVEHRGHPIQRHAQRAFDGARSRQARSSHAPRAFDGARSRQARPSRATIPDETTGGTRLSRPPTERGVRPRNPPGEPHATRLGQKTKPDANTHLAERDWRREGDLNPRYGD